MPCSIALFVVVCVLFSQQCPFSSRFEETPGAEGGSTPQPAAGIKAFFSPLLGKDKQTPDFSRTRRKESVTSFVPRALPKNRGGRPRKERTDEQKGIAPCTGFYSAVLLCLNFKTCTGSVYQRAWDTAWDTLGFKYCLQLSGPS
jgi:hypothetical protein